MQGKTIKNNGKHLFNFNTLSTIYIGPDGLENNDIEIQSL